MASKAGGTSDMPSPFPGMNPYLEHEEARHDVHDCILVSRAGDRPRAGIWPLALRDPLRDPLPSVPIPIEPAVPEAELPLQDGLHRIYDQAQYRKYIYDHELRPPLPAADAEWARALREATP